MDELLSACSTSTLKYHLQNRYPQLIYDRPKNPTLSEHVYAKSASFTELSSLHSTELSSVHEQSGDETSAHDSLDQSFTMTLRSSSDLFHAGMQLRNSIDDHHSVSLSWPPNSETLTIKSCELAVPPLLYNTLAVGIGATDQTPETDKFVEVDQKVHYKLLSLCQDIITMRTKGRKPTPKSLALGLTLKHLAGSSQVAQLLSAFGHCGSYDSIQRLETALALEQLRNPDGIPEHFQPSVMTVLVFDNIDFAEETVSGAGSTHNMNGIMFQMGTEILEPSMPITSTPKVSKRQKTLQPLPISLRPYIQGKRQGIPTVTHTLPGLETCKARFSSCHMKDFIYLSCKYLLVDQQLPSWTGFNKLQLSSCPIIPKSAIHYLPVIEASPNDLTTVSHVLERSVALADQLSLSSIVVVFDQALYSKAQQIRWKDEVLQKSLVLRMGEFHTCMTMLAVIGKMFKMSGLEDILIESGAVAANSITGVLSGHMYNRSIRAHKLLFESLGRMRISHFLETVDEPTKSKYEHIINSCFPSEPIDDDLFVDIFLQYEIFGKEQGQTKPNYKFWSTYMELVGILLMFVRATRESNWSLHVHSLRLMLPWMFAFDRHNYAR